MPDVTEQRAIASILGALDDKIELNRCTNETLEAMARALFQSWFVDFDPVRAKMEGRKPEGMDTETAKLFPMALEESDIGPNPVGWTIESLTAHVDLITGFPFESKRFSSLDEHGLRLLSSIIPSRADLTNSPRHDQSESSTSWLALTR